MQPKWIKPFILSAGGILLAAAAVRFLIAAGDAPALALPEPMLGIPLRYAVQAVGGIEALVALFCLFGRQIALQVTWLTWAAFTWCVGFACCLCAFIPRPPASAASPIPFTSRAERRGLSTCALLCLLLGSCVASANLMWLENAMPQPAESRKRSCPGCGIHIRFDFQTSAKESLVRNARTSSPCANPIC